MVQGQSQTVHPLRAQIQCVLDFLEAAPQLLQTVGGLVQNALSLGGDPLQLVQGVGQGGADVVDFRQTFIGPVHRGVRQIPSAVRGGAGVVREGRETAGEGAVVVLSPVQSAVE